MDSDKIRERIKQARLAMNYSQESMAALIGLSTNSYSAIESGKTRLFHPKLNAIAELLNTPLEELLFDKVEPQAKTEEREKELSKMKSQVRLLQDELARSTSYHSFENRKLKSKLSQINKLMNPIDKKEDSE